MSNINIRNTWENFINDEKYKIYFMSYEEFWIYRFNQLKEFIDKNNKPPTKLSNKILESWLYSQKSNYKNIDRSMNNNKIYKIWEDFITSDTYSKFFK